jgi:hypothetical protein
VVAPAAAGRNKPVRWRLSPTAPPQATALTNAEKCGLSGLRRSENGLKVLRHPVAFVDRVSSLNPDGTVFEVHSVDLSRHPYVYACWLVELDRKRSKPNNRYLIELKDGSSFTLSADEVITRAATTGLPPM